MHRLVILVLLQPLLMATVEGATQVSCQPRHIDRAAVVGKIIDGDTILLQDRTRVRLIGINTPELNHNKAQAAEAFAEQARMRLQVLLQGSSQRIMLQYGQQRRDRYGRLLAHVFLHDGSNVARLLLSEGLAIRVALPPNLWGQDCYQAAESQARVAHRGLWREAALHASELDAGNTGFHLVTGRVIRVGHSRKSVWLNFDGRFAARIARRDLSHFADIDLDQLHNRTVQLRGWISTNGRQAVMRLYHSSMIDIVK